jgi:DNA polymerase III gamma/tau subunit
MIMPVVLVKHFCAVNGFPDLEIAPDATGIFVSIAQTPTEIKHICTILCYSSKYRDKKVITAKDIIDLFSSPSFSLCLGILRAYIEKDKESLMKLFMDIWSTGISYEDFLHELTSSVYQIGVIPPSINQAIHQLILKGWISFAQGKIHSLDLMRLFFT